MKNMEIFGILLWKKMTLQVDKKEKWTRKKQFLAKVKQNEIFYISSYIEQKSFKGKKKKIF